MPPGLENRQLTDMAGNQLRALTEVIRHEGLVFVSWTKVAAKVPNCIVVIQQTLPQVSIQFFEAVLDFRWISFVGFCVCPVTLIQYCFAIGITRVKCVVLGAALQWF